MLIETRWEELYMKLVLQIDYIFALFFISRINSSHLLF